VAKRGRSSPNLLGGKVREKQVTDAMKMRFMTGGHPQRAQGAKKEGSARRKVGGFPVPWEENDKTSSVAGESG